MTIFQCKKCSKLCKGDVLKVKDTFYHVACFKCSVCGKLLAQDGYYSKDDKYYCRRDYKKLLSKICDACGAYILGDMVSVLDKFFHHNCFYCYTCKIKFTPGTRVTYWNNNFYCSACFTRSRHIAHPSTSFKSNKMQMTSDIEKENKTDLTGNTSFNVSQEAETFGEKPIASNLSNQAQDDLCSNFCKELAQRLAVQYFRCENHVSDGTNFSLSRSEENEKSKNEQSTTIQTTNKPQYERISCTFGDSRKEEIKQPLDSTECQQIENQQAKESYSQLNSLIQSKSLVFQQNTPPMQPSIKRSYVNYQNTGKVASLVKFLEGLPTQIHSPIKKRDRELPNLNKIKTVRSISDDQNVDTFSSDTKQSSLSGSSDRTQNEDVRVKRSMASIAEHRFPVEVAITPKSPYVKVEQTRGRQRDKYTSHSQVVVTIRPAISSTPPSVSSTPPPTRQSYRFLDHSKQRNAWSPIQPENIPVVRKRATFQPTPFVEATSACLRHSSSQKKAFDVENLGIQYANQEKQIIPLPSKNEWIDISEQDQSAIMDRVCQRNIEKGVESRTPNIETYPSEQDCQKSYSQTGDEIVPSLYNQIKPSAQHRKLGNANTWLRSTKWILYGRKRKASLQDLLLTAAKIKKKLQDKKQINAVRRQGGITNSKKIVRPICQIIIHLIIAVIVLFTVIGLLLWISEMQQQQQSEQKQIQNANGYLWNYGWKSQLENKKTQLPT